MRWGSVIPWGLCAGLAIAVVVLLGREPSTTESSTRTRTRTSTSTGTSTSTSTGTSTSTSTGTSTSTSTSTNMESVVREAAVLRQCRLRVAELEKRPPEKMVAPEVDVEARRATVKRQIERFLDVTTEQSAWIVEFVCALRSQRAEIAAE